MAVQELTLKNFEETIQNNAIVVIDFWAPWCGPCRAFAPIFEGVAASHPDVLFTKINTDAEPDLATRFQVHSIPTLAIFKEQEVIFYQPGMLPKEALEDLIEQARKVDMQQVREQVAKEQSESQTP